MSYQLSHGAFSFAEGALIMEPNHAVRQSKQRFHVGAVMNNQWEEKLKDFVNKAGDELKRAGVEIRAEAEKLLTEVKDPVRQRKVKEGLKDFGQWAKQTAEEFGTMVEAGVKKAESTIRQADNGTAGPAQAASAPKPSAPRASTPRPASKKGPGKKTIGKKKPSSTRS